MEIERKPSLAFSLVARIMYVTWRWTQAQTVYVIVYEVKMWASDKLNTEGGVGNQLPTTNI